MGKKSTLCRDTLDSVPTSDLLVLRVKWLKSVCE
nr:MAG TPA: hypothetical protein [Caudoviricetes sp.]